MRDIDFNKEVEMLMAGRIINNYMASYLLKMPKAGLNEELWQESIDDAEAASKVGVDNEEDFTLFFYIDHLVEDIVKTLFGIKLSKPEEEALKIHMFGLRYAVQFSDMKSFEGAVNDWVDSQRDVSAKVAHPNIGITYKKVNKVNLDSWYGVAEKIKVAVDSGLPVSKVIAQAAQELEVPERYDFLSWYRYYSNGENMKYNINDQILYKNRTNGAAMKHITAAYANDANHYYIPKPLNRNPFGHISQEHEVKVEKPAEVFVKSLNSEQNAMDFESARSKLMSRIFAIDKLLEKYRKVLSTDEISGIEDSLNDLRRKVRKLKFASSIIDTMVKTANIISARHFDDGAEALMALAGEVAEKGIGTEGPTKEPPKDHDREVKLQSAVDQLHAISGVLKNKEVVRSLAKVDLVLHDLKMAALFPELGEAQSKLIDAFGYASNRIDDMLPKIRGSIMSDEAKRDNERDMKAGAEEEGVSSDKKQLAEEVHELSAPLKIKKPFAEPKRMGEDVEVAEPAAAEEVTEKPAAAPAISKAPKLDDGPTPKLSNVPGILPKI